MADIPSDPMMAIWESVSQPLPTGEKVIIWRNRNDLDYLYETGLVDTDRWKKEDWVDAYRDSLQPDGSYRVTKNQWLAKRPFRYAGPTGDPFDPVSLTEGELSLDDFEKLLKEKILPSTTLTEDRFRKAIEKSKNTSFKGGKFHLDRLFKINLRQLLAMYPSPRRIRELSVAEAGKNLRKGIHGKAKNPAAVKLTPQGSQYSSGPTKEKQMTDQLSRLLGKGPKL